MNTSSQLKWPQWHNPPFPRLSGLLDGLLRKAQVQSGPEGERLYGGRIRVQGERFKAFEAAVEKQLLAAAAPLQKEARYLAGLVREPTPSRTDTTEATRQVAHAAAARRHLIELECDLEQLINQADCTVEVALSQANTYLGLYTKASKFGVLEQEIPRINRGRRFQAIDFVLGNDEKGRSI